LGKLQSSKNQIDANPYFYFLKVLGNWKGIRIFSYLGALQRQLLFLDEANI
jgi:hypothetical protein